MSQHYVETDPLSICDYSLPYANINHQISAVNAVDSQHITTVGSIGNSSFYKTNVEVNIEHRKYNESNHEIIVGDEQNNQSDENNKLESLNDAAHTEPTKLPDNNVKNEFNDVGYNNDMVKNLMNNLSLNINNNPSYLPFNSHNLSNENTSSQNSENGNDIKPFEKGKRKVKKERSTYWSEKITEKDFPFYGCAVCNICYADLADLDKHIATHKDRTTSYDLRVKNQMKRKKLKKEKKKLKKVSKEIKKENLLIDIEIKPEDGYIGNEKASDFDTEKPYEDTESNGKKGEINDSKKSFENSESIDNKKSDKNKKVDNGNQSKVRNDQELMNLQKIFKCFACQKQFTLSYYLKLHVRSHTDEKPYTCPTCGQSFITASKLGRHNKRFHLQIKFQCRICYRYFSRFECLTTHFDRKHPDDKIEGEPYDYNAILPYLKELEEELKQKSEETKLKKEDTWTDGWQGANGSTDPNETNLKNEPGANEINRNHFIYGTGSKDQSNDSLGSNDMTFNHGEVLASPIEVILEEMKPEVDPPLEKLEVEVKTEVLDQYENENLKEESDDDMKVKNESGSDEEYFPDNTWVSTKDESPPPLEGDTDSDPLTCRVCKKKISSTSYMKIHMRTHTGEKPFKCYICKTGFITSSKMHRHVLNVHTMVHGDGVLEIKKEESADNEVKPKKEDLDDADGDSKDVPLKKKVKLTKKSKKTVVEKKKKKYQKRPHACEFCNQRFLHLETLQVHKKSHEGQPIVYKCKFCLVDMENEASLKTHEETHTGPKPYLCTICGKVYKKKETMVYHRKHHKPDNIYVCSVCSKTFSVKCKFQRHALTHRREQYTLRYECPVCAHMFHTKYHVGMHLATHQREGLIVEQNRNEILAMVLQNARKVPKKDPAGNSDSLLPADERSRVCNICGEVFQHFYYLEEHLKNHASKLAIEDEEKPEDKKHVCQVCNKSFKLHYYLKLHSFTHTKEKPYICQQCGKGFITRGKLKRHLETHAGLKKFQCHVCYKFFTRPSYLRTHVRTIHGTQDYNFRLAQNLGMTYPSQHA